MVHISVLQENLPLTLCHLCCVVLCFVSDVFPSLIGIVEVYLCEGCRGHLAQISLTAPST